MDREKNERIIMFLITLAGIGLIADSILEGWEFWMPPVLFAGTVSLWIMHIAGKPDYNIRQTVYFILVMLFVFYHGVHESSFFDIALVTALSMVAFSFFDAPFAVCDYYLKKRAVYARALFEIMETIFVKNNKKTIDKGFISCYYYT